MWTPQEVRATIREVLLLVVFALGVIFSRNDSQKALDAASAALMRADTAEKRVDRVRATMGLPPDKGS